MIRSTVIIIIIISTLIIKALELVLIMVHAGHTHTHTHTPRTGSPVSLCGSRLDTDYTDYGRTLLSSAPPPHVNVGKAPQISPRSLPVASFLTHTGLTKHPVI